MPSLKTIATGLALILPAALIGTVVGYWTMNAVPETTVTGALYTFISGFTLGVSVWLAIFYWAGRAFSGNLRQKSETK